MKDEMPSPYPVWPKMGFDEWRAKMEAVAMICEACRNDDCTQCRGGDCLCVCNQKEQK